MIRKYKRPQINRVLSAVRGIALVRNYEDGFIFRQLSDGTRQPTGLPLAATREFRPPTGCR